MNSSETSILTGAEEFLSGGALLMLSRATVDADAITQFLSIEFSAAMQSSQ